MSSDPTHDLTDYLCVCRSEFGGRVDEDRITQYVDHAAGDPGIPIHVYRLAKACLDAGNVDLWRRGVTIATTLPHDTPHSLCDRGDALLRLGEWSAWQDLDWRIYQPDWSIASASVQSWTCKRWDGVEDLKQRTLLVTAQGGFGDALWSTRFADWIAPRARTVVWDTAADLLEFTRHTIGHLVQAETVDGDSVPVEYDRYVYAMSLPSIVGGVPPFVPRSAPAPAIPPSQRSARARIGLAWACSTGGLDHLERSVPLSVLAPLFWRPDVEWVSLQVGTRAGDANYYPGLQKADPLLRTFVDVANLMASLDGVITVDTSICHLAGVLGVPTVTLLRFVCDPKWGFSETTPWYPTMRLVRQQSPGDWGSVVISLSDALDARWWTATTTGTPAPAAPGVECSTSRRGHVAG
jgi:hypothetical protein